MRLRRYTRAIRIVLVWTVVFMLTVDTASACWWLRCRRSYRCCQPVCCHQGSQSQPSYAGEPGPTGPPAPDDEGWRAHPGEGAVTGYDVEENEIPVAPDEFVPETPEPGAVTGVDPLDELPPAEELPVPSVEEQAEIVEEAEEEELAEESTGDLDEETLGEEATEEESDLFGEGTGEEGDLFGPTSPEESAEDAGDLFGVEPTDDTDTFEPVEEPADEDGGDLFGPLGEADDFSMPAEEPVEEPVDSDGDLFGPSGDLFDEPAAEPADSGDDLFGPGATEEQADSGDDLFGPGAAEEPADSGDDLFGPQPADSGDDLFGPGAGDEFEAPADQPEDDLLGPGPADPAEDDLFGPGSDTEESNDNDDIDDLFGDLRTMDDALAMRSWVDNTGLYSTQGRLLVIGDDYVQLMKDNGHTTTVPLRRLSENDRALVERLVAAYGTGEIDRLASR